MIKYIIFILLLAMQLIAQTAKKNDIPGGAMIVTNEVDPVAGPIAQTALQKATEAKSLSSTNNTLLEGKLDIPRVKAGTGIRIENDGRAITIVSTGVTEPVQSFSATNVTAVYDASNTLSWVKFVGDEMWKYSVTTQKILSFSSDFLDPPSGRTLYPKTFVWPFTANGSAYLDGGGPSTPSWVFTQFNANAIIQSPSDTSMWGGTIAGGVLTPYPPGEGTAYLSNVIVTNITKTKIGAFYVKDIATNVTWMIVASNGFFEVKPQ